MIHLHEDALRASDWLGELTDVVFQILDIVDAVFEALVPSSSYPADFAYLILCCWCIFHQVKIMRLPESASEASSISYWSAFHRHIIG